MRKRKMKWILMICCLICTMLFCVTVNAKTKVTGPEVVAIGNKKYMTLKQAVKAVKKGQTITYLQDDCYEEAVVLDKNTSYTIDFKNVQTFSLKDALLEKIIVKKGTVTVKNGKDTSFEVGPGGKLIMQKGKFGSLKNSGTTILKGAEVKGIWNADGTLDSQNATVTGNMTVAGGKTIINKGTYKIYFGLKVQGGTVLLKGGHYLNKAEAVNSYANGKVIISGGTYEGMVRNSAQMTIEGGTLNHGIVNSTNTAGKLLIKGGVIKANGYALSCGGKGATDITGGTFVSKCGAPIMITDMKQTGHVSIKKAVLRTKPGYERGAMWVPKKNNENIYISKENILFYGTSRLICE